jgi:hypothetical protein
VPYSIKAPIVSRFFASQVTTEFPATMLKNKAGAELYLDAESISMSADLIPAKGDGNGENSNS